MNLQTLSAAKIESELAKRDAAHSIMLDRTIAAGMGQMRHTEIMELAKGDTLLSKVRLAKEYLASCDARRAVWDEIERREKYHGSRKPIRAKPAY